MTTLPSDKQSLAANYRWWQEHGGSWADVIARRKRFQPYYFCQEAFLAEYMSLNAPTSILDFGCGFGRHLRYLREIPGVEIFGYDQSTSMVEGIRDWAGDEWFEKHIQVGEPLGRLPYPDKSFDIVLTVSVLLHVQPEDLDGLLAELTRVARKQIIHLEPNAVEETTLFSDEHDGCWAHPLHDHYARLGLHTEVLPKCYRRQDIYRVVLDPSVRPAEISKAMAERLLDLDSVSGTGAQELYDQVHQLAQQLTSMTADRDRLWQEVQQWHQEAQAKDEQLQAMTQDRDRLWQEVQQWHHEAQQWHHEAQAKDEQLQAMTQDRDRLWDETQQWHQEAQANADQLQAMTADRDRLWDETQLWHQETQTKDEQLQAMTQDRNRLWAEVQQQAAEIEAIKQSPLWRWANKLWRLRGSLL